MVKICGITRREDAEAAVACGADALGFVFWPTSPRYVEMTRAREIVASLPPSVTTVGVFVNQAGDEVNRIASEVELDLVQLHGDEGEEYVRSIERPVIKAVPFIAEVWTGPIAIVDWLSTVRILFDVHDPVKRGGTGRTIDWTRAGECANELDFILAGGLTPENVGEAIARAHPYGIDVSSGVESSPGIKDHKRLKALFEAVHGSHHATRS
jgi:phosphoribosylanthranilate isomerase